MIESERKEALARGERESDPEPRKQDGARRGPALGGGRSWWLWPLLLVLLLLWSSGGFESGREISYSAFRRHLAAGEVVRVRLSQSEISGELLPGAIAEKTADGAGPTGGLSGPDEVDAEAVASESEGIAFHTVRVDDEGLVERLEAAGVPYEGVRESGFGPWMLIWLLPSLLMLGLFVWWIRSAAKRAGGQLMGFGKSKAHLVPEEGTGVTFDDVAGCDEAKQELAQMVSFLRNPSRFTALGGRIPKGVLLLGPPGTGKTLLARAIAGEAGVPFFSLSGSDFVEMFVGVGAARVRDLFEQAKAKAPCIVFVDEIDAIGRQRGVSMGAVNDEREQTLNQLLAEMDGFENNSGVILLAATNRPEVLDKALLRPGRFDRQVVLDSPDLVGREQILAVHVSGKPLAGDVDLTEVARATPGMSGADLANVVNEAALLAADRGRDDIGRAELQEAVERVLAGPERRSRRIEPNEKRRIAFHEAGHALVAARVEHAEPVQKITIVPRGHAALGYTMQLPSQEHYLRTKRELLDRLAVMLGGRASEELVFGDVSTGAQDDLRQATNLARRMVSVFGMSDRVGLALSARPEEGRYLGDESLTRDCSERTAREIDLEVRDLLATARDHARSLLERDRDALEHVAEELLEQETLDRERFLALVGPESPAEAGR